MIKCEKCNKEFSIEEALQQHNKAKHSEKIHKEKEYFPIKKIRNWSILIIVIGLIIAGIIWWASGIERFPPTDIQGHIELNPDSHILKEPMPIAIQKHMLEHADGTGRP